MKKKINIIMIYFKCNPKGGVIGDISPTYTA